MNIIEAKHLTYKYGAGTPFEKTAVSDISFSIEKGEFIGIIGHTGSGKSTLMQMLNGLIRPDSGEILLDGENIWKKPKEIRKVRFRVGMVFQYPEYQLFEDTVYSDIAYGAVNKGISGQELDKTVRNAAKFAGLPDNLLEKSPFELSGGEKRRAAIAGIMAMQPEVLVLDEPTAGLDPMGREFLLSKIREYHRKNGNTVILVSHSMEDIAKISDRVIVMNKGRLEMYDTTENVFSQGERLKQTGLKIPEITYIMNMLSDRGYGVKKGILTVEEAVRELLPLLKKF